MRIGIDIDGVLTDVEKFSVDYFSKYLIEKGVDYKIGQSNYVVAKAFGVDDSYENAFWKEYLDFYAKEEPPRKFAAEVIKKLKDEGYEIYIITARWLTNRDDEIGENMRQTVASWLSKHNFVYDKLVFSRAQKEQKSQEILENKIDIMIEDNPYNIMELSKLTKVICYDATFNRECEGDNIFRCYSWYDIYKKIRELNQNEKD